VPYLPLLEPVSRRVPSVVGRGRRVGFGIAVSSALVFWVPSRCLAWLRDKAVNIIFVHPTYTFFFKFCSVVSGGSDREFA
jgi:hypothetical protein